MGWIMKTTGWGGVGHEIHRVGGMCHVLVEDLIQCNLTEN